MEVIYDLDLVTCHLAGVVLWLGDMLMKASASYHTSKLKTGIFKALHWPVNTQNIVSEELVRRQWCVRLLSCIWLWISVLCVCAHVASRTGNNLATFRGQGSTVSLLITAVSRSCAATKTDWQSSLCLALMFECQVRHPALRLTAHMSAPSKNKSPNR